MRKIKDLLLEVLTLFKFLSFIIEKHKVLKETELFFFFPFYHTGGAEKVHADIVSEFEKENTFIFFTAQSNSEANKKRFISHSDYYEIYDFINQRKLVKKIFIKYLTRLINKNEKVVLFACSSHIFYELLPYLKESIKKVDLLHMFTYPHKGGEVSSLPYVKYVDKRIVINKRTKNDYKNLYKKNNLSNYLNRVQVIYNGIELTNNNLPIKKTSVINIAFVGRWCIEKRPELYLEIAKKLQQIQNNFKFYFAGTSSPNHIKMIEDNNIISLGDVKDPQILKDLYKDIHFLVMPSKIEGFPVVIMESMHFGVVPVCTDIGGISEHVFDGVNGIIIEDYYNTDKIVDDFVEKILSLDMGESYSRLSLNAFNYAKENYCVEKSKSTYRKVLLG